MNDFCVMLVVCYYDWASSKIDVWEWLLSYIIAEQLTTDVDK